MKITAIDVGTYDVQLKRVWSGAGFGQLTHRSEVIIRLRTDEGISGIGHVDSLHHHPRVAVSIVQNILKPVVIGEDPFNIEHVWEKMYEACGYPLGITALGGVNVAMWDIVGKKLGVPIYKLLGGDQTVVLRPYIGTYSLGWRALTDMHDLVEEAKSYVKEGYTAIKIRGGRGLPKHREDIEAVKALRNEFGDEIDILIDANGGYTFSEALIMASELEKYNVFWLEDPVYESAIKAKIAEKVNIPIHSGGAKGSLSRFDLKNFLEMGGTDIIGAGTEHGGGISEMMKMIAMVSAWDLKLAPHAHEVLGSLATFHAFLAAPKRITDGMYMEWDPGAPWEELLTDPPRFKDGRIVISDKPGLGTDVKEKFITEHALK